jgi:hypothetical protein
MNYEWTNFAWFPNLSSHEMLSLWCINIYVPNSLTNILNNLWKFMKEKISKDYSKILCGE